MARLPNFVVIGAPKCGTTSLFYYLQRHPEVYLPVRKELHFFTFEEHSAQARGPGDDNVLANLCSTWPEYLSHYVDVGDEPAVGEVSPSYLASAAACPRIRERLGPVKILAILRDPVQKAFSQYLHLVHEGRETLSFVEALRAEEQRRDAEARRREEIRRRQRQEAEERRRREEAERAARAAAESEASVAAESEVFGAEDRVRVPLSRLCLARSGDKGDTCNVGVIARSEAIYGWMVRHLTSSFVKGRFEGIAHGEVERFELRNLLALNFLLHESLGGGGTLSLLLDAQGKTYAQYLLAAQVLVDRQLLD